MVRRFFVVLMLVATMVATPSFSQNHEVSVWSRDGSISPWYFYSGSKVVVDVRYNLDLDKTLGSCLGKTFGEESFSIVPEVCAYLGEENGFGPELWVLSETKRFSVTSYFQYARFREVKSFEYSWFQAERKISRLGLGLAGQTTKEKDSTTDVDLGLSTTINLSEQTSLRVIPMWRVTKIDKGDRTLLVGLTYSF